MIPKSPGRSRKKSTFGEKLELRRKEKGGPLSKISTWQIDIGEASGKRGLALSLLAHRGKQGDLAVVAGKGGKWLPAITWNVTFPPRRRKGKEKRSSY